MTAGAKCSYFAQTSGLGIYTHLPAAEAFSTCLQFFLGFLAWHLDSPLCCSPGPGHKNFIFFSLDWVTSKIRSTYFVWTSGVNIYISTQCCTHSKHPQLTKISTKFTPTLHLHCRLSDIYKRSSLALPCHLASHWQLTKRRLPEFPPILRVNSWRALSLAAVLQS